MANLLYAVLEFDLVVRESELYCFRLVSKCELEDCCVTQTEKYSKNL